MTTIQALQTATVETVVSRLLGDVLLMGERFLAVLLNDPLAALLLMLGGLLIAVSSAVFGGLSVGGLFSWFFRLAE
jgi:hypothetical protein